MSFREKMAKQTVAHPSHEILLSNQKERTINAHNNLGEYAENMLEVFLSPRRLQAIRYPFCNILEVTKL